MQNAEALDRVAAKCAEDLAADGVVYAEIRFAPELHIDRRASPSTRSSRPSSQASGRGLDRPEHHRACALLRHAHRPQPCRSPNSSVRRRDAGVCGFDTRAREAATRPRATSTRSSRDARGLPHHDPRRRGVRPALHLRRPCRSAAPNGSATASASSTTSTLGVDGASQLGRLACYVRDTAGPPRDVPVVERALRGGPSIAEHPIGPLTDLRFRVTVNTDNRLMSRRSLAEEFMELVDAFGWELGTSAGLTINAMKSAFLPFDQRLHLINRVIKPGFAMLGADG